HGLLVDEGDIELNGTALSPAQLGFLRPGTGSLTLRNTSPARARAVLLGGPPFEEEIVMWWNFIGRSHDDIVRARQDWEEQSERFGAVEGYAGERLPAPELPNAT
ncbi:pirin family protein, partial [Streptomyces sp. SID7982]|nr:pirin family protein [Streptomyces sp. SID7982]